MKVRISLRTRIIMLVLIAIVPLLALSLLKAWLTASAGVNRATENLKFAVTLVAGSQERIDVSTQHILMAVANAPGLLAKGSQECQRYLQTLKKELSMYRNLGLIGLDGYFLCDGVGNTAKVYAGDRAYFKAALTGRGVSASGYMVGRGTNKPVITFSLPVEADGKVVAVAFASVDLAELSRVVGNAPMPNGTRFAVTDRQGIVLAASPDKDVVVGQPVPVALLQEAVKTMRSGSGEGIDATGAKRIYAFMPAGTSADARFFVSVSAGWDRVTGFATNQMMMELIVLALTAFLGTWMAWMMGSRAIVRPTNEILEANRKVESGMLDARVPESVAGDRGEFARLGAGFNQMAEALEKQRNDLQAELARSDAVQQKLHDAQRLGRIGYWQLELATSRIWWSDEVYELMGVKPGNFEVTYESFLRLVHPDDLAAFKTARDAAVQDNLTLELEFRIITGAGDIRWIHQSGRAHGGGDGVAPTHRTGVIQDITERKRAEVAVTRNTELLNRTGEMAKIGGWELMLDRMVFYCSDQIFRIHDMEPGGSTPLDLAISFYAPEAQPLVRTAIKDAIEHGQPWDLVLPFITARGRRILVRLQGRPLMQDGKTVRLVGAFQDVTEQQEAQAQLKLLEAAVSRLNDIVLITEASPIEDPGPRIVFVNDAFERRTGYSREEVLGKSPRFLQGPQTQRAELDRIRTALQSNSPVRAELINYTKDGQPLWLELDIVPIADSDGRHSHFVSVERDVTHRKLAEQALVESEQRYAALFLFAPVPMWIVDDQTLRFLAVNEAAVHNYGYSREEFLQMTSYDIRNPAERQRLKLAVTNAVNGGANRWTHVRKDGVEVPVEVVARLITFMGTPARFVVSIDITAQVQAEKAAQNHLFTLQRAADAAQAITAHQTLEGAMEEVAEQSRSVIGAHHAVVSVCHGGNWEQALHTQSFSEKYAGHQDAMSLWDGSGIYAAVCEANRPMRLTQAELEAHPRWKDVTKPGDNTSRPMRGWLAVPLTGHNGENIGLLQLTDKYEGEFTIEDQYVCAELAELASIAIENASLFEQVRQLNAGLEQKVAERTAALTRQEAMSRALAEQAPQIIWNADADGKVTYVNQHWYDLMGGTRDEWLGDNWTRAVHPDDLAELHENWRMSSRDLKPYVGLRRLLAKDGTYHTMSYRAAPVLGEDGKVMFWVGIDADVSEIKAIESALRLSNQELEAFSYSVSHDLRSPLNTVDGFSRLLSKQLESTESNEKVRHYLSRIQAGVAQMGRLIEDLLSLAQVSRTQMRQETVDLSAIANEIAVECRARNPERSADIHIEDGLLVQGDGRLIRVVMENLVGNAWKFTSQKPRAEIRVGYRKDSSGVSAFYVQDNGAGFDMAFADKLFNTFQRLHAVTEFPGTGVGLAIVSRVIGRHRGHVWAESEPGRGATFFFTLPPAAGFFETPPSQL